VRLAPAIAVIAVAFSVAAYLHQLPTLWTTGGETLNGGFVNKPIVYHRRSWNDPTAVAIGGRAVAQ
jgi:hypothetical protein